MKLFKEILDNDEEFKEYYFLVDKIEKYLDKMPDISIECCKSLFEGLSKNILSKLTKKFDSNLINKWPVETVVNNLLIEISNKLKVDESINNEFKIFKKTIIEFINEIKVIRNVRGDISHGRNYPKLDFSTSTEAKGIVISSDLFLSKLLVYYNLIDKPKVYHYEDYEDLNISIDEKDSKKKKKTPYSKLLYLDDYTSWENELYKLYPDLE